MPSAQDILDSINGADARLDNVNNKLDTAIAKLSDIVAAVQSVDSDIQKLLLINQWGFTQLITLGTYTNLALFENNKQNETIICILEQISRNTCSLLNEAHLQTTLDTSIEKSSQALADLYAATHAEAALTREREAALRAQIEACCPPPRPDPVCTYQPCPSPPPVREQPPQTAPPPKTGPDKPR